MAQNDTCKMNQLLCQQLEELKLALLSLQATGENGFEGLIGVTLREISGVPFRLAGSGAQFGIDGKPTYEGDYICFEGKRYDGTVPRNEVISKIAELTIKNNGVDIWVLGASSQINSQLADDVRELGTRIGVAVVILDWSEIDLPPFAVALAMGGIHVEEFLEFNINDRKMGQQAIAALEAIRNSQGFATDAERIRAQCNEPAIGLALARRANTDWLNGVFSSRKHARTKLGQPLSPGDTNTVGVRQRKNLIDILHTYLTVVPDDSIVFVLGGEGCGKSWIVAQSWLALAQKPLMVFMSPDDFTETAGKNDIINLLISKLINQTGDMVTSITRERWYRRLKQWQSHQVTERPRLIIFIDGINQRPKSDWGRIIEKVADELNHVGGRLIITARAPYFLDRVKGRLSVNFAEIQIPEWTELERDEILSEHGIKTSNLHPAVAASLRNPRLLGVALELLDKADVINFEELSVSRLLFEHMRMSERDAPIPQPAQEFARRLQIHAQEIISRVNEKQQEDINIFEDDMEAVADGRFFQTIDGDPTHYSLQDEGLTLALGFSVIDLLRTAKRNHHNLDDELETILEPISALDNTADVIIAALTVTTIDKNYGHDITAALVRGFTALQNPDQTKFPIFAGLMRRRPQGFMDAAQSLSLAGGYQSNFDWVSNSLIEAGRENITWQDMVDRVHFWLSAYSLSPELGTFSNPAYDPEEKVLEEREKNRVKIENKLCDLSSEEQTILESMPKAEGDLSRLSRLALMLLAGKSLEPFARSILNWSFSFALNSDHAAPFKEFIHLVSLNQVDWLQTRKALLELSAPLREEDVSKTGKWALVNILRATGHSDDGKEAQSMVDELTKDMDLFGDWRLIESYCNTDPCDPTSEQPNNITPTAEKYEAIDVSKLRRILDQTSDDHFFEMARPCMARFKPEVVISKHREFAIEILSRTGLSLRQGLFELRQHNALLTIGEACQLIKQWGEAKTASDTSGLSDKDMWIISQYRLLLAFPFLSAREQVDILLSIGGNDRILRDLIYLAKPLDEKEFESLLETTCIEDNSFKQYLLLALAKHTSIQLSEKTCTTVASLFRSESEQVRIQALGLISQSCNEKLLSKVVESNWKATETGIENDFEVWYGSAALLEAAARGLISHNNTLNRISPRIYGRAATILDEDAVCEIARRIDASINKVVGLDGNVVAPDIEVEVSPYAPYEPSMFSVNEREPDGKDIRGAVKRLSESKEDFEKRMKRNYDAFFEFKAKLTEAKARIILDHISLDEFAALVGKAQDYADRWYELFKSIDKSKLPAIYNLALLLAYAIGKNDPIKAKDLFRLLKDIEPLVRFTFGKAGIQLDAMATWAVASSSIMDTLCFERLDRAGTDQDLSLEVLTAILYGKQRLLTTYIEAKLSKEEPAEISRGIMVAGFSDQSEFNDEIIKRYEGSSGLIGSAGKAAKYAYVRNVWARYWYDQMCQTDDNTDFWRYAVMFSKIVDGRFIVWHSSYIKEGSPILLFGSAVNSKLKDRFARWKNHRDKKMFGLDAPESIFLQSCNHGG